MALKKHLHKYETSDQNAGWGCEGGRSLDRHHSPQGVNPYKGRNSFWETLHLSGVSGGGNEGS